MLPLKAVAMNLLSIAGSFGALVWIFQEGHLHGLLGFAAFTTADVVLIKAVGRGMAVAVALDATLVRLLLVPPVMRLFGAFNWWAPGPIARLRDRVGPPQWSSAPRSPLPSP